MTWHRTLFAAPPFLLVPGTISSLRRAKARQIGGLALIGAMLTLHWVLFCALQLSLVL